MRACVCNLDSADAFLLQGVGSINISFEAFYVRLGAGLPCSWSSAVQGHSANTLLLLIHGSLN